MKKKSCSKCKELKSIEFFGNDKRYKDGKYPSCKMCKSATMKKYYNDNRDEVISRDVARKNKRYQEDSAFRKKKSEYSAKYQKANRHKYRKQRAKYQRIRRKNNLQYRLAHLLRNRLYDALKNQRKNGSAVDDLGCSLEDFIVYIESQWYDRETGESMSWDNHSVNGWHIDHIEPLSLFDLSDPEQLKKACHYTNMKPMWSEENRSKGGINRK